jgi:hypothetical protein
MAVDRADMDRRVAALELLVTELLARAGQQDGSLFDHLDKMLTQKGPTNDRDDHGPDTVQYAKGVVAGARKLAQVHQGG